MFRYAKKENYSQADVDEIIKNHHTFATKDMIAKTEVEAQIENSKKTALEEFKKSEEYSSMSEKLKGYTVEEFKQSFLENPEVKELLKNIPEDRRKREISLIDFSSEDQTILTESLKGTVKEFYSESNPPEVNSDGKQLKIVESDNPHNIEQG